MHDLAEQLDLMDALLARSEATLETRPVIAAMLRKHVLAITKVRMRTGYSAQLAEADVALTRSLSAFQFAMTNGGIETLRIRLRTFHAAALAAEAAHAPLPLMADAPPLRRGFSLAA